MSTSYYAKIDVCHHCGRCEEEILIGKSRMGWTFNLHVYESRGLNSLDDWKAFLKKDNVHICDDYDQEMTIDELLLCITERSFEREFPFKEDGFLYQTEEQYFYSIGIKAWINGLCRNEIGSCCIGYGDGTWDLIRETY